MDPYGFALENYDGTGRWRSQENNLDVDASGEINGQAFTTPVEFRKILAQRQDDFRVALVRKMVSYALGRRILASDRQTIEQIATAVKADGDRFTSLIFHIVNSYPFQHARGTPARVVEDPPQESPAALFHPVWVPPDTAATEQSTEPANRRQRRPEPPNGAPAPVSPATPGNGR
jgi:hypothetical protein